MKPREIFRLAIKVIGFIILLQGFRNFIESLLVLKGYTAARSSTPGYWAAWGAIKLMFGTYLMTGAAPFVAMAFSIRKTTEDVPEEIPHDVGVQNPGPRMLFDLIVKTLGLIVALYGLQYVFDAVLYAMELARGATDPLNRSWLLLGIAELVVGVFLLRASKRLVDFAFPENVKVS